MPEITDHELAVLLREDRPQPTDDFTTSLDARVARGFESLESAPRVRRSFRSRFAPRFSLPAMGTAAAAVVVVVVALAVGQQDAGDDADVVSSSGSTAESTEQAAPQASPDDAGGGGSSASSAEEPSDARSAMGAPEPGGDDSVASPAVPPAADGNPRTDGRPNRKVERSAALTLAARPRDIDRVSAGIQEVTRAQGGFVVSSSVNASPDGGAGRYELRIPTRNLDAAMAALSRLGQVRERAQQSQDITAEAVSARSRLKDARTERTSLLGQLAAATTPQQTAAIRARLRDVSAEIEQAEAGLRRVRNRASFATVAVTLVGDRGAGPPVTDDESGWTPGDAARDALRGLEIAAGVAIIALAVVVPVALIALLAGLGLRSTRRRKREHALDAV